MKLLIVDSINSLISPILGGGQTHGHMVMMELGRVMKQIAVKHNIACIVSIEWFFRVEENFVHLPPPFLYDSRKRLIFKRRNVLVYEPLGFFDV